MDAWTPRSPLDHVARLLGTFVMRHRALLGTLVLAGLTIGWLGRLGPRLATSEGLLVAVAAIVPVAIAMAAIRYTDRTSLEPWHILFLTFFLGALLAVVAAFVNSLFAWLPRALHFVLVVGPIEEITKLAAVYVAAYRTRHFDHAIDGVYYGVAAAAGFAAIENVFYAVASHEPWTILLARTLISTPSHILWAALAGYYLGVGKFIPEHRTTLVTKGLLLAAMAHAIYNLVIGWPDPWGVAAAGVLGLLVLALLMVKVRHFYGVLGTDAA